MKFIIKQDFDNWILNDFYKGELWYAWTTTFFGFPDTKITKTLALSKEDCEEKLRKYVEGKYGYTVEIKKPK